MIPTYRIAERKNGQFTLMRGYILDNYNQAKVTLEEVSRGNSLRDYCIVKAVWDFSGKDIIGWVFLE